MSDFKLDDVSKSMLIIYLLAFLKNVKSDVLPKHLVWQLNAYTNWNLILLGLRHMFCMESMDPFLFVNSLGILLAYKTGFAKGIDKNILTKLRSLGSSMTDTQFFVGDIFVHVLPVILTFFMNYNKKKRILPINVTYAITLATWFSFRQNGMLDASSIYVPHPWKRSWLSGVIAMVMSPFLMDAALDKNKLKFLKCIIVIVIPYLTTKLDVNLEKKYKLEFLLGNIPKSEKINVRKCYSSPGFQQVPEG